MQYERPVQTRPRRPLVTLVLATALAVKSRGAETADHPSSLPEFFVTGERVAAPDVVVPRGDLRPPEPNLGQELLAIPGVYSHARAADAMEPSIRGLGFDRVATTINGVPLLNGSPERTNSPVVILGSAAVAGITLTKALPSVTLGPVTTGGRISLDTDPGPAAGGRRFQARLETTYHGGRDGVSTRGWLLEQAGAWDAGATFFRNSLGDYVAADGRQVAARLDDHGASASLGWHSGSHRIRGEVLHRRLRLQEAVSLPLDGKNTDADVISLNHRWTGGNGALESITWRAGYARTDPYITSEDRKVPTLTSAVATATSLGGGVTSVWRIAEPDTLAIGADYVGQNRRAIRTTAAGQDFIWPNARYDDTGAFAEWRHVLSATWRVRLGTRWDDVRSEARDADRLALGKPIREQYVTYNGPAAADVARHDAVGAANLLFEWKHDRRTTAFIGAGLSAQPAAVMERYRAFLNALGGDGKGGNAVELGNPALGSERKLALEAGGSWQGSWLDLAASVYFYRVDDFILRTPIGATQPPLAKMVVFGYRNVDAELHGAEVAATLKPAEGWQIPLTFARADGRNRSAGVGLADIPPWEASGAARYRGRWWRHAFAGELGVRVAGEKSNPAPTDNPLFGTTGGFSLWHFRFGVSVSSHVKLEAGAENVFDRVYTEYLSPPVAPFKPASGNLLPGQRVPGPGRFGWVSVTVAW